MEPTGTTTACLAQLSSGYVKINEIVREDDKLQLNMTGIQTRLYHTFLSSITHFEPQNYLSTSAWHMTDLNHSAHTRPSLPPHSPEATEAGFTHN